MFVRSLTLGTALLVGALPLAAQDRGTVDLGVYPSYNSFASPYQMNSSPGFGLRVGAYLSPRWALEFDGNAGNATRPLGLADRSFGFLDARLLAVPVRVGRFALLVGAGASHVDANVDGGFEGQSYGYHLLGGGRVALNSNTALRLDYTRYFNGSAQHASLKAGLSLFRAPRGNTKTIYRDTPAAPFVQRPDSVSAAETRRLRTGTSNYDSLRDSLNRNPAPAPVTAVAATPSSVAALETMLEMIHFEREQAELDAVSRAVLDDKVPIFNANPDMRIVITGYASAPGTDAFNMALGFRRATAAKAYLVSRGVDQNRIEISTKGENNLLVDGPGDVANSANRRGQFRLLIADPYLVKP